MKHHKIFSLPKPLWALLVLSNIFYAIWIDSKLGSNFGWTVVDLSNNPEINQAAILAVIQFALFALTVDMTIRFFITISNGRFKTIQVPAIAVMATSFAVYGVIGLLGFILLYDHNLTRIIATLGAMGLGAAYAFKDWISDTSASIQIQTDQLVSINDYIQVDGEKDLYKVTQIDHRFITIEDKYAYLINIPTRQFLGWKYININKQPTKRGIRRRYTFELTTSNDSSQVLALMDIAMRYLVAKNNRFYSDYVCHVQELRSGVIVYGISCECEPSLSVVSATNAVLSALIHIFRVSKISFNSDMEIIPGTDRNQDVRRRLVDIYRSSILAVLSPHDIESLSDSVKPVHIEDGAHIIQYGDQAQSMYFILEGHLEVRIPRKDAEDLVVANLWPGDCVGEMSLLTGEPRSANVFAKSNSLLLEISKENLEPFLEKSPKLIEQISQVLTDRQAHNAQALLSGEKGESTQHQIKVLAQKIFKFFFPTKV